MKNFVIVDYENVQLDEKELRLLRDGPFELWICCGAQQSKLNVKDIICLQSLGLSWKVRKAEVGGAQALDMQIAYLAGELAAKEPSAFFHFISKDGHFQQFAENLRTINEIKVKAASWKSIREIGVLNVPAGINERICEIQRRFSDSKTLRPKTRKTLKNYLNGFFYRTLEEEELETLVAEMVRRKMIGLDAEKVTFHLP